MQGREIDLGPWTGPVGSEESQPPGQPSMINRPIFIVGCPRSGTSALKASLDSHPRISCGPEEGSLFWLARTDTDLARRRRQKAGVEEEAWLSLVRHLVEELMRPYAESLGKTRWGLKHPELATKIPWLDKLYPTCQVIHIVRNPNDVIASNQDLFGLSRSHRYGKRWVEFVRDAERDGRRLGRQRFKTVRYEDLVSQPEEILRDIVNWLGEPWSDEVLHSRARTHTYPPRLKPQPALAKMVSLHTNSVEKSVGAANLASLLFVKSKGSDLTSKFGYHVVLPSLGPVQKSHNRSAPISKTREFRVAQD
jgi:protein-tyrosine sulfotransferase